MPNDAATAEAARPLAPRSARASAPTRTGETVTVACKLPNGLILQAFESRVETIRTPLGSYEETVAVPIGESFTIKGAALDLNAMSAGVYPDHQIYAGAALTPGCPKDLWDLWLKQHHDAPFVKNGLVFAAASEQRARDQAKEHMDVRSGLEPIAQGRDPRITRDRDMARVQPVDRARPDADTDEPE